jgi:ABC-type dipeptide/oligopeptide/nickel transport system ATPase subunit
MAKIIIKDLKGISSLEFDIPNGGVHVLTGSNGSGKTTLLTCLQRIADKYAFQKHFRTSRNNQFDNYSDAQIEYEHQGNSVTYAYNNTRWSPNPRRNSNLLRNLGYTSTIFISSTGERFYVQNEELNTRAISSATVFVKDSMNEIFETDKYSELRRKKLDGRGRGEGRVNYGFLMYLGTFDRQAHYFTEKNFSLGEVLVLNTLFQLEHVANNSLILIDEIELALHPRVQVNFLRFLERIARQRNLTVILSTHSSSLIRACTNLLYLEKNQTSGHVTVEKECYPAVALQNISIIEDVQPDVVFFVEDLHARYILDELITYYFTHVRNNQGPNNGKPIYKILPVGGWGETIRFLEASVGYLINGNTTVYAFLDADVEPQLQGIQANANRSVSETEQLNLYNRNRNAVKFLPITPELGIVRLLQHQTHGHRIPLQQLFNAVIDITVIVHNEANRGFNYSQNARKEAKVRLDYYIEQIQIATNRDTSYIKIKLAEYFARAYCQNNQARIQQLLHPVF